MYLHWGMTYPPGKRLLLSLSSLTWRGMLGRHRCTHRWHWSQAYWYRSPQWHHIYSGSYWKYPPLERKSTKFSIKTLHSLYNRRDVQEHFRY